VQKSNSHYAPQPYTNQSVFKSRVWTPGHVPKNPPGFLGTCPGVQTHLKKPGPKQSNYDVIFHSNKVIFLLG